MHLWMHTAISLNLISVLIGSSYFHDSSQQKHIKVYLLNAALGRMPLSDLAARWLNSNTSVST